MPDEVKRSIVLPNDLDERIEAKRLSAKPVRILRSPFIVAALYKVMDLIESGEIEI